MPPSQLDKQNFKGDYDFTYKHEHYYPFLLEMTAGRREAMFSRWQARGEGKCGASEYMLRGGEDPTSLENEASAPVLGKERTDMADTNGAHKPNGQDEAAEWVVRQDSADSFVTTREIPAATNGSLLAKARDDDLLDEKAANSRNGEVGKAAEGDLSTGVAGLAIKPDGSIGAA